MKVALPYDKELAGAEALGQGTPLDRIWPRPFPTERREVKATRGPVSHPENFLVMAHDAV
jgi:hypothetical protein